MVLILSQYLKSMDKYRYDNTQMSSGKCYWVLDDEEELTKCTKRADLYHRI